MKVKVTPAVDLPFIEKIRTGEYFIRTDCNEPSVVYFKGTEGVYMLTERGVTRSSDRLVGVFTRVEITEIQATRFK